MSDASSRLHRILDQVYRSCADDPHTSVHRAWSVSIIFILLYFILSMVESKYPAYDFTLSWLNHGDGDGMGELQYLWHYPLTE
jgi:hypothetical protein